MINKILYKLIALGGTFDHLHEGHKNFLKFANEISKSIIIGVVDQQMTLGKEYPEQIQPTHVRKQAVANFCNQHGINAKIITIFDPFGPTIEENKIEAIVCTNDTLIGANKINEVREKLHLRNLPIHIYNLKKDKLNIDTISAKRIRGGEIDRQGNVYLSILKSDLKLNDNSRHFFAKIHGKLFDVPTQPIYKNALRIVVGDSTLETFIKKRWHYDLGIFDGKCQRKKYQSKILESIINTKKIENKSGYIQNGITQLLIDWKNNQRFKHIFVDGEEDLTAVAAALILPLGTTIYYGQPNEGMVESIVTEDLKEQFFTALSST